jgi:HEAT repeat protein
MLFRRAPRRYALVDSVIARARTFPSGDHRRWQIIGELATADVGSAVERASELIRSEDPAAMTLGAELFDQLFIGMREGRRFAPRAEELLRAVCVPTQDPEVLAAALHPYAELSAHAPALLYDLLAHPDERVRRSAAQLVGAIDDTEIVQDRQVDALIDLLERDPDPGVREEAAQGLDLIVTCRAYVPQAQRIEEALSRRLNDPIPGVRASALVATSGHDLEGAVKRLVTELAAADVRWQFVDAFNRLPRHLLDDAPAELRADAHQALRRLLVRGWPDNAHPGRFPVAQERSEMLDNAITATAPERPRPPQARRPLP